MRLLSVLSVVGLLFALSGCLSPATPYGTIYAQTSFPGYYDGVSQDGPGSKTGQSEMTSYIGMIATGDASIQKACDNGGITKIKTVDHHYSNMLGIVQKWQTSVTGE